MDKLDKTILTIDEVICKNIDKFDGSERGLLAQNILSQLRNFVEYIALKELANGQDIEINPESIKHAPNQLMPKSKAGFIRRFHNFLQGVASHYTQTEENSERLMLKYFEILLRLKAHMKTVHGMDVLRNLDNFPIHTDSALQEYYEKIVEKIERPNTVRNVSTYRDRYYIQKIKPFFVDNEVYYEVTYTIANEKVSKFDRVIAFTKLDILENYATNLTVIHDGIEVLGKKMPILIIDKWETSIRPCELNNFANIVGERSGIQSTHREYRNLMDYLTETRTNLVDVINFPESHYEFFSSYVLQDVKTINFLPVLDKCRRMIQKNEVGENVCRYLLHTLNNRIIKLQRDRGSWKLRSDFNLHLGCKPFDSMPFSASLIGHNPHIADVFDCIDCSGREHELLARRIKNNAENSAILYNPIQDLPYSPEVLADYMSAYNKRLYLPKHNHRLLKIFNDQLYIEGYEADTIKIINELLAQSKQGIANYSNSVKSWLNSVSHNIDSQEKKEILTQLFENSRVAMIYGAAGTGKTRLIEHISDFFNDSKKLYLAKTNPAVENLRRRVGMRNQADNFLTIDKFKWRTNISKNYDLIVVDECSTVSNKDMVDILEIAKFKSLILVGDVYQIEAISYGSWFDIARAFLPETTLFELTVPYRTTNDDLIEFWGRVRNIKDNMLEHMTDKGYTTNLDESIFDDPQDDEIILCLNYDGLYGINNLNKFLQGNNKNAPIEWGIHTYKIGDPVLFNETERFAPIIYNNLKGKLVDIQKFDEEIVFQVEIDRAINELQISGTDLKFIGSAENGNSIVSFVVKKQGNTDEDDESNDSLIPFQVAYAVSIHKAQGLEYKSVKIVITNESEEMITHNIFYTAVTRAKEILKIYWTPETEKKVLESLKIKDGRMDARILASKLKTLESS